MKEKITLPQIGDNVPRLGNGFSQWLGTSLLRLLGWKIPDGFPNNSKMVVAVAPHTSNWDFVIGIALVFSLRLKISFFGKHSIFIPPFDRLLKRWGGIPIERTSKHGIVDTIAAEMEKADAMILGIAPEGTRSKIPKWKTGFMHIAQKTGVPVFLIGLDYGKKEIVYGPLFPVDEEIETEMKKVYAFYANVQPKFPEKFAFPTEK